MNTLARLLVAATVLTALPAAPGRAQQPFTLEQVMSAPFPEALVAAPTGGAVAWVFNDRGARNIWIAAPPDYQGKPVTTYTGDDGQEIGELQWTPDAKAIVYVRGGGPNGRGETPNPHSLPEGVEQDVWVVAVSGGAPPRPGEGASPPLSPQGDRVAFLRRGQIWWGSLADSAAPQQPIHARGPARALAQA